MDDMEQHLPVHLTYRPDANAWVATCGICDWTGVATIDVTGEDELTISVNTYESGLGRAGDGLDKHEEPIARAVEDWIRGGLATLRDDTMSE